LKTIDIGAAIFNFKIKCQRKLNREEQIYLDLKSTMRDLAMFRVITKNKNIQYNNTQELEKDLCEYINVTMIIMSASPIQRDIREFEQYGVVPHHISRIIKGIDPYKTHIDYLDEFKKRNFKYRIEDYYNKAYEAQEKMKREAPKKYFEILGEIFDYYGSAALAFSIIQQPKLSNFDFEKENCEIYDYLIKAYTECPSDISEDKQLFYAALKDAVTRKFGKRKVA
jgi:hypothetical protein